MSNTQDQQSTSGEPQSKRKCSRSKTKDPNSEVLEIIKDSLKARQLNETRLNEDDDRNFLLSLVGDLKKVDPERKMSVKLQIMQVINQGIAPTPTPAYSSYYPPQSFPTAPPVHHSYYPTGLQQTPSYRQPVNPPIQPQMSPVPGSSAIQSPVSQETGDSLSMRSPGMSSCTSNESQIYDLLEGYNE